MFVNYSVCVGVEPGAHAFYRCEGHEGRRELQRAKEQVMHEFAGTMRFYSSKVISSNVVCAHSTFTARDPLVFCTNPQHIITSGSKILASVKK